MTVPPVDVDYLEETGPGVTELPEVQPTAPETQQELTQSLLELPGWTEESVATFVQGAGAGIHLLIGQTDQDWLMTKKDLQRIVPPLTRICNRWEPAVRLSPYADPLLVAHGFALYGWRSALEAKRAQRDRAQAEAGPGYETGPVVQSDNTPNEQHQEELEVDLEDLEFRPYFPNGATNED